MRKVLKWLDEHLLHLIAGFLLLFIPLYPKLPLLEVIPGYIVRVRIEDLFIAGAVIVYAVYVLRGKAVFWATPLTKPILIYLIIGALSLVSAITIVGTIPIEFIHLNKAFLHYLRRIEYFSLFFIFFTTVKSLRQAKLFLALYLLAMVGVTLYGYGQKYLYWCAFSTMNREFAKGWCLYLTEHARVISTFGGHYDLAAFTMVALVVLWSLVFGARKIIPRVIFLLILAGSFWLIILTASRVSFLSYLVALTVVIFLWMFRRGVGWATSRWFMAVSLSILVMLSFGDLSDRFLHLVKFDERFGGIRRLLLQPMTAPPKQAVDFLPDSSLALVTSKSDQPPSRVKPGKAERETFPEKPADVNEELPDYMDIITDEGEVVSVPVKRTFSKTALRFDLSTGIRLDVLWPRAWRGFLRNPLLGSGYSTLTKARVSDFTEAESTDNDYLRVLGETGALGAISFFAIIIAVMLNVWWALPGVRDPIFFAFLIGSLGAIVGLLVNAIYIDVFEASKVALPFWSLVGVVLGGIESERRQISYRRRPWQLRLNVTETKEKIGLWLKSDGFLILVLITLSFIVRLYRFHNPLADWHSWRQADTSAVTRNFFRHGINFLYPAFDDLSSVASGQPNPRGLRMVEFPLYNSIAAMVRKLLPEVSIEEAGRLTSIIASLGSLIFLFHLTRCYLNRRTAFFASLFFAILPFNIYYSRTVLPEPFMVFTSLGMLYFFDRWLNENFKFQISNFKLRFLFHHPVFLYLLALFFAAASLLVKPYAGFLFIPLIYLIFRKLGWKGLFKPSVLLFFGFSVLPFVWWRWWVSHFPEGIPAYMWLFNGDGIRFKGAFFFWIFADRIGRLILGYWGLPILFLGIIARPARRQGWFLHVWLLSILLYLFTFATGNVRHDYYQTITIPILAIFLAIGSEVIFTMSKKDWNTIQARVFWLIAVTFMLMFSWYHIRDFFNINHPEIVEAGRAAKEILKPKGLVVAPYDGDTAFLYQIDRSGWPIVEGTIDDMIAKGAHYYVSVRDDDLTRELVRETLRPSKKGRNLKLLKKTPTYTIIQLVRNEDLPE